MWLGCKSENLIRVLTKTIQAFGHSEFAHGTSWDSPLLTKLVKS